MLHQRHEIALTLPRGGRQGQMLEEISARRTTITARLTGPLSAGVAS
jgi:hypothetical protein